MGNTLGLQTARGGGTGPKLRHESLSLVYERGSRSFCALAQEGDKKFGHLCILGRGKILPLGNQNLRDLPYMSIKEYKPTALSYTI